MKLNKKIVAVSSLMGIGAIGMGIAFNATSCSKHIPVDSETIKDIAIDEFAFKQAEKTFVSLIESIFDSKNQTFDGQPILPSTSNGISLTDAKASIKDIKIFFAKIEQMIQENINTQNNPQYLDAADYIQASLQLFPGLVRPIFSHFAHSFVITFLVGEEGSQKMITGMDKILSGEIQLKTWSKDTLHLNELFFDGVLTNFLKLLHPNMPLEEIRTEVGTLITGFYGNPGYLGVNHSHIDGRANPDNVVYFNTLPDYKTPEYTKYDGNDVKPGDLMYSANGFAFGDYSTGHMAMITGWKYSNDNVKYLQVVEPNQYGESYGAIDDSRVDSDSLSIIRINNASEEQRSKAATFANDQVGKDYYIPLIPTMATDYTTSSWYCSELCGAAYISEGIDIQNYNYMEGVLPCEPGASPHNIYNYAHSKVILQNEDHIF